MCGKTFTASPDNLYYCSPECASIAAGGSEEYRVINREPLTEKLNSRNKTGVRGVHFNSRWGKFIAKITVNKVTHNLGHFDTLDEAVKARHDAEAIYYKKQKEIES